MMKIISLAAVFLVANFSSSFADIIYQPVNPSFGGNYLNSSHLQFLASSQKKYEKPREEESTSAQFLNMLESRLYSALAAEVTDAIFGENALPNGTITFDDQQVAFINTGTEIQLIVTDFTTGQVTNITIPTLQSN